MLLRVILGLVALVALLLCAGLAWHVLGSSRDRRRYPPLGRMVDVGGHRLHLWCTGEGEPTVVMDSGLPGTSLSWRLVQPELAKVTRVCSYDRAGLGWSDAGPRPRTSRRIVEELRALLSNAGIHAPYVLVGHSFGALTARLFASEHPEEVVGMVLVDPVSVNQWLHMNESDRKNLHGAARISRHGAWAARLGIARMISLLARMGAARAARIGVTLVSGGALKQPGETASPLMKVPAELRPIIGAFWIQPKFYEALASQIESLPESAARVAAAADYGDIPLAVLSATNTPPGQMAEHQALARLSSNGKHLIASDSSHWIQLDQPELVIHAIQQVVEDARRQQSARSTV